MEVGNIVLNGVLGSIANVLGLGLNFEVPWYANTEIDSFFDQMMISSEEYIIYAKASMLVKDHQIEGVILLLFDISTIEKLGEIINSILNSRL
jgi:chemotaxis protein CheC